MAKKTIPHAADLVIEVEDGTSSVRMKRYGEGYKPPHSADVHIDEVENWAKHGWEVDEDKPNAKADEAVAG